MTEIYSIHGGSLKASFGLVFVDTLERVATHAHQVNSDRILRFRLQQLRATTLMPDPPLLRLEGEAFHAYLNLVQQLPKDKPELATQVDVDARLVKLCQEVLKVSSFISSLTRSKNVNMLTGRCTCQRLLEGLRHLLMNTRMRLRFDIGLCLWALPEGVSLCLELR